MILSLACLPSYAGVSVSVVDKVRGGGPYLGILQDKAETSGDRLEWTEVIYGVSHSTEE